MWLRILVFILITLIIVPILVMIPMSFGSSVTFQFPPSEYSLRWYENFINDETWMNGFWTSLMIAPISAILSTILGVMAALAVSRFDFPGKSIFTSLMVAPMILPLVIVGVVMYHSFTAYKLTDTILGLTLAHSILAIPLVFVTVLASLQGMDRNLELAALNLGSTPIGSFFKVTLPLIRSSVFAGFLFAFITSFDEVVVSIFLVGPSTKTIPIVMWENMRTQIDPTIATVSSILIVGIAFLFILFPKLIQANLKGR